MAKKKQKQEIKAGKTVLDLCDMILDYAFEYYDDWAKTLEMDPDWQHPIYMAHLEIYWKRASDLMEIKDNHEDYFNELNADERKAMLDAIEIFTEHMERDVFPGSDDIHTVRSSRAYLAFLHDTFSD